MQNKPRPNPDTVFPIEGVDSVTYIKPTIKSPNIIVGDFSYYSGSDFESRVTHHYDFYGDKLIIGKFCQIGANVEFIMNGANHQMNASSTFPFYIFGWDEKVPPLSSMPIKGDTVVGNDVWFGQNCTILPGVHIGDGAIIGTNSTVGHDVEPYSVVVGNPAHFIRKRFDTEMIAFLEKLKWWDLPFEKIESLIPLLTNSDLNYVKAQLKKMLKA